jgi:hypothetical protein
MRITVSLTAGSHNFGQNRSSAGAVFAYLDGMLASRPPRESENWETNAGKRWDPADLFFLISAVDRGLSIEEVAGFLQRPANEVQEKARGAGAAVKVSAARTELALQRGRCDLLLLLDANEPDRLFIRLIEINGNYCGSFA